MKVRLEPFRSHLRVHFAPDVRRDFTWRWLRDNGQDPHSLDPATRQRLVDTFALQVDHREGEATVINGELRVAWGLGMPPSRLPLRLLAEVSGVADRTDDRAPWTAATAPSPEVAFEQILGDAAGLGRCLDLLARHGFAVVTGVPDQLSATAELIDRFGPVRNTVFGDVWTVVSGSATHADSAYRSSALEPHTDGTYSHEGPGLQVLHFTQQAASGGETILTDGLAVYEQLRSASPEHVETLTVVAVPGRYVEPGIDLRAARPAIRVDADGRLVQLSFNNYDRAPLWLPPDEMRAFYAAYSALHDRIVDPDNWHVRGVQAGQALVVDNWRVLHGRRAFSGERRFQGGYVNHEDVASRRRTVR